MNTAVDSLPALPSAEFLKVDKIEPPKRTWFYQKQAEDWELDQYGQPKVYPIFACSEQEAANLGRHQVRKYKQVGFSDGLAYFEHLRDNLKVGQLYPKEEADKIYKEAWELELAKARGHIRQPRSRDRFWGGATAGTANIDEFRKSWG